MRVIIDLCIVPIGIGTSLSKYISICENEIKKSKLKYILCPNGTSIEGEWDEVFEVVKNVIKDYIMLMFQESIQILKLGTRVDKIQTLEEKINAVNEH